MASSLLKALVRPLRLPVRSLIVRGVLPLSMKSWLPYTWCVGAFPLDLGTVHFLYRGRSEDSLTEEMFWTGLTVWEKETTAPFLGLVKQTSLFVDVGANSGLFTLLAISANPNCEVIALEPVTHVYRLLEDNLELNGLKGRCQPMCAALSDQDGPVSFYVGDDTTAGSLAPDGVLTKPGKLVEVEAWTLDTLLAGRKPGLIKIDVEGHEPTVLRGMRKTLETARPNVIFECNPGGPWAELYDYFKSYRYRVYHLVPGKAIECSADWSPDRQSYRNYLSMPEESVGPTTMQSLCSPVA